LARKRKCFRVKVTPLMIANGVFKVESCKVSPLAGGGTSGVVSGVAVVPVGAGVPVVVVVTGGEEFSLSPASPPQAPKKARLKRARRIKRWDLSGDLRGHFKGINMVNGGELGCLS
jgi:hypothetical protein